MSGALPSMRNDDPDIGVDRKEIIGRIWWAHFALERFISATIGLPSQAVDRSVSVPLPLPISSAEINTAIIESRFRHQLKMSIGVTLGDQNGLSDQGLASTRADNSMPGMDITNSGTYLTNIIQLCEITQGALQLYNSNTHEQSWQEIQETISSLNEELGKWVTSLPEGLNFLREDHQEHQYARERNSLDILYHNTRILVNRPCLCRLDRRMEQQATNATHLDKQAASACVSSALTIASGLASDPTKCVTSIYKFGPWWNMVHTIMRSLIVLLLEVSLRPRDRHDIVPSLKKLIRWLRAMRTNDAVARRAYKIAFNLSQSVAAAVSIVSQLCLFEQPYLLCRGLCCRWIGDPCA